IEPFRRNDQGYVLDNRADEPELIANYSPERMMMMALEAAQPVLAQEMRDRLAFMKMVTPMVAEAQALTRPVRERAKKEGKNTRDAIVEAEMAGELPEGTLATMTQGAVTFIHTYAMSALMHEPAIANVRGMMKVDP